MHSLRTIRDFARRHGAIWVFDAAQLSAGAAATLPAMLRHTRGSSAATVRNGATSLVTGLGTDVAGVGRNLDADPLGLVIEESRQVTTTYNQDLGNAAWTASGTTVATDQITAPDGTNTADKLTLSTTTGQCYHATNPSPLTATPWILSVFAAAGTSSLVGINFQGNSGFYASAVVNLATGAVTETVSAGTGGDASVMTILGTSCVAAPNSFYRASLACKPNTPGGGRDITFISLFMPTNATGNSYGAGGIATGETVGRTAYYWGAQLEHAAFATEHVPTTSASVTRAGARLWLPYSALVTQGRRLELRLILQAKGAHTDYASSPYLFKIDANNYATISNTDGKVTIVVNGASYTTASGVTWAQGDVLDLRIGCGGGIMGTFVECSRNGAAKTSLGTTSAQAALPVNGTVDLLQDGSAANVLSCRLRKAYAYAPGTLQGVA